MKNEVKQEEEKLLGSSLVQELDEVERPVIEEVKPKKKAVDKKPSYSMSKKQQKNAEADLEALEKLD